MVVVERRLRQVVVGAEILDKRLVVLVVQTLLSRLMLETSRPVGET